MTPAKIATDTPMGQPQNNRSHSTARPMHASHTSTPVRITCDRLPADAPSVVSGSLMHRPPEMKTGEALAHGIDRFGQSTRAGGQADDLLCPEHRFRKFACLFHMN